jgi:VanZ family protein
VLAVLLSVYVLFAPSPSGPEGPPGADKAVHLLLFALLAVTARWRLGSGAAVLTGLVAYAAASELVQGLWLAERSGDLRDLAADLFGVALGWLLARRGALGGR